MKSGKNFVMIQKIKKNIVSIVAIIAGSLALGAFAGDFVLYAAKDTHAQITSNVAALTEIVIEDRLSRLKKELYMARTEETKFKRSGQPVPDWLIKEIIRLQTQIKKLEKKQ